MWNHPQSTVVKAIFEQILNLRLFLSVEMKQTHPTMILFSNYLFFKQFGPFFRRMEFLLKLWVEMKHCDYFDLWGKGTKVTVASGKSHLKLNFEIISLFVVVFVFPWQHRRFENLSEFEMISSKFICCKCTWISSLYSHFKVFVHF